MQNEFEIYGSGFKFFFFIHKLRLSTCIYIINESLSQHVLYYIFHLENGVHTVYTYRAILLIYIYICILRTGNKDLKFIIQKAAYTYIHLYTHIESYVG